MRNDRRRRPRNVDPFTLRSRHHTALFFASWAIPGKLDPSAPIGRPTRVGFVQEHASYCQRVPSAPFEGGYTISVEFGCYSATALPIAESFEYSTHDCGLSIVYLSLARFMDIAVAINAFTCCLR